MFSDLCIPLGSLNRVPALIGWGKGGNVTSAGLQLTLCDPIWHASSRSGAVLVAQSAIRFLAFFYQYLCNTSGGAAIAARGVGVWFVVVPREGAGDEATS